MHKVPKHNSNNSKKHMRQDRHTFHCIKQTLKKQERGEERIERKIVTIEKCHGHAHSRQKPEVCLTACTVQEDKQKGLLGLQESGSTTNAFPCTMMPCASAWDPEVVVVVTTFPLPEVTELE